MSRVVLGATVRRWLGFASLAAAIVVADQLVKAYIVASYPFNAPVDLVGDWARIWYIHNTGALFGLFHGQAALFGIASLGVIGIIIWFHGRSAASGGPLVTLALGLLLGGAIGNLIDRLRLDHVIDFLDVGIGSWRWYTFNVADAAISTSIVLLVVVALLGGRGERGADLAGRPGGSAGVADETQGGGGAPAAP